MLQLGKQLLNFTSLLGAIKSGNIENIRTSFNKLKNDLTDLPSIVGDAFKNINFTDSENKIDSFIDKAKKAIFGIKTEAANVVIPGIQPTTTVTGGGGGVGLDSDIDKSQAYATALLPNFEGATEQLRTYNTELEKNSSITDRVNATFDILSSSITPIIDGVFNALESGQNVFKALVRGVKDLIVNLIKAVAQAAILSAINEYIISRSWWCWWRIFI